MMSSREQIANLLTDHSPRLGWDLTKNDCHPCTDTCGGEGSSFSREEMLCSGLDPGRAPSRSWSIRADPSPRVTPPSLAGCHRDVGEARIAHRWGIHVAHVSDADSLETTPRRDVRGGESRQRRARTTSPCRGGDSGWRHAFQACAANQRGGKSGTAVGGARTAPHLARQNKTPRLACRVLSRFLGPDAGRDGAVG